MSLTPFFFTGTMARIKVSGVTMAFCTDISYSVRVKHATPKVLGMFESFTVEPLAYDVNGSFRLIRYTKNLSEYKKRTILGEGDATGDFANFSRAVGNAAKYLTRNVEPPNGVDKFGNGIGAWSNTNGASKANQRALNSVTGSSNVGGARADQSLDPSKLYWPQFFDIEIFQKAQTSVSTAVDFGMVARLRNCRITGTDFVLTKRTAAQQTFTFTSCYADEDTFIAEESGVGQSAG